MIQTFLRTSLYTFTADIDVRFLFIPFNPFDTNINDLFVGDCSDATIYSCLIKIFFGSHIPNISDNIKYQPLVALMKIIINVPCLVYNLISSFDDIEGS